MLMGTHNGPVHVVNGPITLPVGVGVLMHRSTESLPDPRFAPAVEATRDRTPWPIPLREIPPWDPCTEQPEDTVQNTTMISGWAACLWFLGWEPQLQPLPLSIGEFMSVHTQQYTAMNRVCKHALVWLSLYLHGRMSKTMVTRLARRGPRCQLADRRRFPLTL